jgi:hypothetical protein
MTRRDNIAKTLGPWLGKARAIGEPPQPAEAAGTINRLERVSAASGERPTQLNFKISQSTKKRIKQLAVRDNITLLTMLDRMLDLYEREHGKLGSK